MQIKKNSLEKLKTILHADYGVELDDEQANQFGTSLLKLSKLANVALARADEFDSSVVARERTFLAVNTSM